MAGSPYYNPETPGAFGIVYVDGEPIRLYTLTPEERAKVYQKLEDEAKANALQTPSEDRTAAQQDATDAAFKDDAEARGFVTNVEDANLSQLLEGAGVDMDDPEVRYFVQNFGDQLSDPSTGPLMIQQLAAKHPNVPATQYSQAMAASGFDGQFGTLEPQATSYTMAAKEGSSTTAASARPQNSETQPDTGWIRYASGVLVDPSTAQVIFDPTSHAPGSPLWQRETVQSWSSDKVAEWKRRLHEFGYLNADQQKVDGVDQVFLNALAAYHTARYVNGGKPVAGDLAGSGAGGTGGKYADQPLMDFEDMSAQIRNDVRDQYRRVFGNDPTDGDVSAWSDYIMSTGMELQKKYRSKEYGSYQTMAATEAEERFVTKLESSPQAQFVGDATEENTRMRDALSRAVQVTQSLAG